MKKLQKKNLRNAKTKNFLRPLDDQTNQIEANYKIKKAENFYELQNHKYF